MQLFSGDTFGSRIGNAVTNYAADRAHISPLLDYLDQNQPTLQEADFNHQTNPEIQSHTEDTRQLDKAESTSENMMNQPTEIPDSTPKKSQ